MHNNITSGLHATRNEVVLQVLLHDVFCGFDVRGLRQIRQVRILDIAAKRFGLARHVTDLRRGLLRRHMRMYARDNTAILQPESKATHGPLSIGRRGCCPTPYCCPSTTTISGIWQWPSN